MTKKLEHPHFLTFEQVLYDPNRKQITRDERRLLRREGLDLPPEGKTVIDGDIVVVSGSASKVPIGFEWVLPEHLVDRARDEFGIIPQLPAKYRRRLGWEEQNERIDHYFASKYNIERRMCELMVSAYPDDFYMYENYLIYIYWLHCFGNEAAVLDAHLGEFSDSLKGKIMYYYKGCVVSRLQAAPYSCDIKKKEREELKAKKVGAGSLEPFMK